MSGLRERKRLAAMRRIQQVAFDLFDSYGYERVTVEQVAEAADVSASSVYRYFGAKEQLVLWDEYDPAALRQLGEQLRSHPPDEAFRRAVLNLVDDNLAADRERIQRMIRFTFAEPSVAAAFGIQVSRMAAAIAEVVAHALGRDANDLDVRVFGHAVAGAVEAALRYWYDTGFAEPLRDVLDSALTTLTAGLELR